MIIKLRLFRVFSVFVIFLAYSHAVNALDLDIRTNHKLSMDSNKVSFTLALDQCSNLSKVIYHAESGDLSLDSSDFLRNSNHLNGCQFIVEAKGAVRFYPAFTIYLNDGTSTTYSETFTADEINPTVSFERVSIASIEGKQYLSTVVQVGDNQDIRYVGFSVVGVLASDLKTVGGVVEKVKQKAFVNTNKIVRIFPNSNSQSEFVLNFPLTKNLTAQAIALDAV